MKAFLFTAGKGTRLSPLTQILPKPAIPLLNIPLIEYSLQLFRSVGVTNFAFNLHHLPLVMQNALLDVRKPQEIFTLFDESQKILGSSGALPQAKNWWGDDDYIFLGNGDECYLPNDPLVMNQLLAQVKKEKALACLLVKEHPGVGTEFGGIWLDSNQQVRDIGKFENSPYRGYHYTGYAVVSRKILKYVAVHQEQNIFYDTLLPLIKNNTEKVTAFIQDGFWSETGNPSGFFKTHTQLLDLVSQKDPRTQFILENHSKYVEGSHFKAIVPKGYDMSPIKLEGYCSIHSLFLNQASSSLSLKNSILLESSTDKAEFHNEIQLQSVSARIERDLLENSV